MNENCRQQGLGPTGFCICPRCEQRIEHQSGVRCQQMQCPQCGCKMLREGSEHHALWLQARANRGN